RVEGYLLPGVVGMVVATVGVGLPGLDHRVFDVVAVAVVDDTSDHDPLPTVRHGQDVVPLAGESHGHVGSDRLRWGLSQPRAHSSSISSTLPLGPRSTMSKRHPSAQFSSVTSWSYRATSRSRA